MKLVLLPAQWEKFKKIFKYTEKQMKAQFIKGGYVKLEKEKRT